MLNISMASVAKQLCISSHSHAITTRVGSKVIKVLSCYCTFLTILKQWLFQEILLITEYW